jgi:RNA polymerase sigma-70 factor (ECF subfamily)
MGTSTVANTQPNPPLAPADFDRFEAMVRGLVAGDQQAYFEFWELYGKRLKGFVDNRFPSPLKPRMEPEDLVQSACRSFFLRATSGRLEISDGESLWRLLCAISLNKLKMKYRFHSAVKRDLKRERDLGDDQGASSPAYYEPAAKGSLPDDAAMFAEQLEQVLNTLSDFEQQIVRLKLEEFTNEEIADKLGCSERTLRRNVHKLRAKLAGALPESFKSPSPESP